MTAPITLEIYVNKDEPELYQLYTEHAKLHNANSCNNAYPNAGFDLFIPSSVEFTTPFKNVMVDLKIRIQMWEFVQISGYEDELVACSYYMYPRSSISKTPLMLSNHTGIIDSGYRNSLMAAFRCLGETNCPYTVEKNTRLVQICHPSLNSLTVHVFVDENQLTETTRKGGFGSTGTGEKFTA